MLKKKKQISLDRLHLTNPQKESLAQLLTMQKNKYKKLLHEAHERLHIIADLTSSLEFWINVNGKYEHISSSCERVLGWKREDFLGGRATLEGIMHEESLPAFKESRVRALRGQAGEADYKYIHRDGSVRWVHATWNPVHTRRGRHIGIRVSLTDISDQKKCQELAQSYESMFLRMVRDMHDVAVFTLDAEGRVAAWNRHAADLTGMPARDVIGRGFELLHAEDEYDHEHVMLGIRALDTDPGHTYMAWMRRADGTRFMANIVFTALRGAENELLGITCLLHETRS